MMFDWLNKRLGTAPAMAISAVVYALMILLVLLLCELPTDTFRYLDM